MYTYSDPTHRASALAGLYDEDDAIEMTPTMQAIEAIWGETPSVDPSVPGSSFVSNGSGGGSSGTTARLPNTGTGVNWQPAQPQSTNAAATSTGTDYLPWVLGVSATLLALYFIFDDR